MSDRTDYIAGLRAIADALEATPEIPLPTYGTNAWQPIRWVAGGSKDDAVQVVRGLGGTWRKEAAGSTDQLMLFAGQVHGVHVDVLVNRESVCERVVTGTREVTKTVPVKTEEVTVTEDVVEWVCKPLLAEAVQS